MASLWIRMPNHLSKPMWAWTAVSMLLRCWPNQCLKRMDMCLSEILLNFFSLSMYPKLNVFQVVCTSSPLDLERLWQKDLMNNGHLFRRQFDGNNPRRRRFDAFENLCVTFFCVYICEKTMMLRTFHLLKKLKLSAWFFFLDLHPIHTSTVCFGPFLPIRIFSLVL
jgi:hypothetical protein